MRLRRLAALGAAISLASAGMLASPAQAANDWSNVDYVALGDSYSSGMGAGSGSLPCIVTDKGYPVLWANSHKPKSFKNGTCAGAVTDTVLNTQLGHLSANTDLVTISIGGNDVNFAGTVLTCTYSNAKTCQDTANKNLHGANLPARLDKTYAAIKEKAPNARVIVLGYPNLYEATSYCLSFGEPNQTNRKILVAGGNELDELIKGRAEAAGFEYVSVRKNFEGHNVCVLDSWMNGSLLSAGTKAYHPNEKGYRLGYLPALNAVTG